VSVDCIVQVIILYVFFPVIQETSSGGLYAVIGGVAGVITVLIIIVIIIKRTKGNM
jgi:uncharacterized membrane protein